MNLMFDSRVRRGPTYSKSARVFCFALHNAIFIITESWVQSKLTGDKAEQEKLRAKERGQKQLTERRNAKKKLANKTSTGSRVEEDVYISGHSAQYTQTERYLEELPTKPAEFSGFTQTDEFLPPEPEPLYMRPKYGIDVSTQVDVKEVFDFDAEVEPILEVITGKVIQRSVAEIIEEQELKQIESQEKKFQQERNTRLAKLQNEKKKQLRLQKERENRVKNQKKKAQEMVKEIEHKKVLKTADVFMNEISETVFQDLIETGKIEDPVQREIKKQFMPWLEKMVANEMNNQKVSRKLVDCIIKDVVDKIHAEDHFSRKQGVQ